MKQKVNYEYCATIFNGNEKLIKTSAEHTELVYTKNSELIHTEFGCLYPNDQGEELYPISKQKFENAKNKAKSIFD